VVKSLTTELMDATIYIEKIEKWNKIKIYHRLLTVEFEKEVLKLSESNITTKVLADIKRIGNSHTDKKKV
jgi:hypothetical protein